MAEDSLSKDKWDFHLDK